MPNCTENITIAMVIQTIIGIYQNQDNHQCSLHFVQKCTAKGNKNCGFLPINNFFKFVIKNRDIKDQIKLLISHCLLPIESHVDVVFSVSIEVGHYQELFLHLLAIPLQSTVLLVQRNNLT